MKYLFVLLLSIGVCEGAVNETAILKQVSRECKLTHEQEKLLFAIRKVENGRLGGGIEFGVGQDFKTHPAKRYAGRPEASLRLQAQWAAGTIKKRYKGDLTEFAKRYCPKNAHNWEKMIRSKIGG